MGMYIKMIALLMVSSLIHTLPVQANNDNGGAPNQMLNSFVNMIPKWTKKGLLDHIIELVIANNLVHYISIEIINGTPDYHSGAAGHFLGATWTLTYVKTTAKSLVRSSGLLWWEKH